MASPEDQSSASRSPGDAQGSTSTVSDLAHQATEQARHQAARAVGQTQERAQAFLSEQKEVAAEHIDGVVKVLHDTVDQLRQRSPGAVSEYAERAVDSLDSVAQALREQDMRALVGQVEDFARRQPVLFLAGSVAIGFAVARFLKSSSQGHGQGSGASSAGRASSYGAAAAHRPGAATEYSRHMAPESGPQGTSGSDYQASGSRSPGDSQETR